LTAPIPRQDEQYAYFTVGTEVNAFDPDEVTARLGLTPTKSWRAGEVNPVTGRECKFDRWSLYSRLAATAFLEEHLRDVLDQIEVRAEAVEAVSREFGASIALVAYYVAGFPGLHIDSDIVARLARFDLSVDCDFYDLSPARGLNQEDTEIVGRSLRAAVSGPYFPDWEFATLFGSTRSDVEAVLLQWPRVDLDDPAVEAAVVGSLNHLLGYPHGMMERVEREVATKAEIARVLRALRPMDEERDGR